MGSAAAEPRATAVLARGGRQGSQRWATSTWSSRSPRSNRRSARGSPLTALYDPRRTTTESSVSEAVDPRDLDYLHDDAVHALQDSDYDELHGRAVESVMVLRDRLEELVAELEIRTRYFGVKVCRKCAKETPTVAKGRSVWLCHACDPKRREYRWRTTHGIANFSVADYESLEQTQNGVCAICGQKERTGFRLAVDHDHDSGAVRGLLCSHCNTRLGYWERDVEALRAAIAYLERSPER